MNTDFFVASEAIRPWFSNSRVTIIAESLHEWQKSLFMVTHTLFYFSQSILWPDRAHKAAKTIIDCSFRHFGHIHRLFLRTQICRNAIFTSEQQPLISISPTGYSGLAYKKCVLLWRNGFGKKCMNAKAHLKIQSTQKLNICIFQACSWFAT